VTSVNRSASEEHRIRRAIELRLTKRQAAERLGVCYRTVQRYEAELRWGVA
jgi:hypothetical protein